MREAGFTFMGSEAFGYINLANPVRGANNDGA